MSGASTSVRGYRRPKTIRRVSIPFASPITAKEGASCSILSCGGCTAISRAIQGAAVYNAPIHANSRNPVRRMRLSRYSVGTPSRRNVKHPG